MGQSSCKTAVGNYRSRGPDNSADGQEDPRVAAEHAVHEALFQRRLMTHFIVYSPRGTAYMPEVTIDEARMLISERSLFEGEPGWEIVPLFLALDGDQQQFLRKRNAVITEAA